MATAITRNIHRDVPFSQVYFGISYCGIILTAYGVGGLGKAAVAHEQFQVHFLIYGKEIGSG